MIDPKQMMENYAALHAGNAVSDRREIDALTAQLAEARANLRLAEIRINGFIGAQADAQAQSSAKDKRIAELEQLATLSPIKLGDISITMGLTETGEARMIFDGADDATLAVVAGKFADAMLAIMESAKDVPNA